MNSRSCLFAVAAAVLGAVVVGAAGCGRPDAAGAAGTPAPSPSPAAQQPPAGPADAVAPAAPANPSDGSGMAGLEVSAPATINTDVADVENQAVRSEVLKRVDVMPNLADDEKDKLYVQVERARGLAKVITVPFASGARTVTAPSLDGLKKALRLPQVEKFSGDPTVAFVVLGFADKKGDPQANQKISLDRAEAVAEALKSRAGVMNVIHAVGMGGSEIFDASALDKNRVVEVWAVLP